VKRSGHIPWGEYRLGLLVFVGLLIFVWASIRGGGAFFERRTELKAQFTNVQGLTTGSPVWFRGVEVGSVSGLSVEQEGDSSFIAVRFRVQDDIVAALNSDAYVRIEAINFFGEKFVDLIEGTPGAGPLAADQLMPADIPPDMGTMIRTGEVVLLKLDVVATNLAMLTEAIGQGEGTLGALLTERGLHDDLKSLTRDLGQLARSLDESQGRTAEALVATAQHLDTLMVAINQSQGTVGLMLRDPRLYESLASASASADTTMGRVKEGEGSVGKALTDEEAYAEFAKTLQRLNILLEDIQKNPKKYFKFSVF
jgi:phospholipid/cholesterol/gamma-HCH transport system substrate-binding protein